MEHNDSINLADLPRELNTKHGKGPTYRNAYNAVVNGLIPATKSNGRWYIARRDLSKVAQHFSLK